MDDVKFKIPIGTVGSLAGEFVALIERTTKLTVDPFIRAELIKSLMSPVKKLEIKGAYLTHPSLEKGKHDGIAKYREARAIIAAQPARKRWKTKAS